MPLGLKKKINYRNFFIKLFLSIIQFCVFRMQIVLKNKLLSKHFDKNNNFTLLIYTSYPQLFIKSLILCDSFMMHLFRWRHFTTTSYLQTLFTSESVSQSTFGALLQSNEMVRIQFIFLCTYFGNLTFVIIVQLYNKFNSNQIQLQFSKKPSKLTLLIVISI